MQILTKILLAPLNWLLRKVSPLGKPVDTELSDSFYYNKSRTDIIYSRMGNWFELGKDPLNADTKTFKVLNRYLGKDKTQAYFQNHPIPTSFVDLDSFHASTADWLWHIGLDKDQVYLFDREVLDGKYQLDGRVIDEADPASFKAVNFYWSIDASSVFYNYRACQVEASSFKLINNFFVKDASSCYLYTHDKLKTISAEPSSFERVDETYARDVSNLYLYLDYYIDQSVDEVRTIPYTDFNKVRVLQNMHIIVDDKVYYKGHLMAEVNAAEVKIIRDSSDEYIKDDQHVYHRGKVVKEADVETFHYDERKYIYKDKNHRFLGADIDGN